MSFYRPPRRLPSKALGTRGIPDISPEELANALSIFTDGGFSPDELLSNSHALLALADDNPRRQRLYLAVLHAQETQENGDRRAVIRHELEFTVELLILSSERLRCRFVGTRRALVAPADAR